MGTQSSARRPAWAGDRPGEESARKRLIEATAECIARDGIARVGVAAVAQQAGVSRPTVYRYFANRDELVIATIVDAGEEFSKRNQGLLQKLSDPRKMAVESAVHVLSALPEDRVLSRIWSPSKEDELDAAVIASTTHLATLRNAARQLEPLVSAACWNTEEALEAAEVYTRFVVSLLLSPEPRRTKEELRAFLRRHLLPAMGL